MEPKQAKVTKQMCILSNAIRKYIANSPILQEIENITGTHGWVIAYLTAHEGEDIYQRDLEREFGISRSSTSKMLALMERKGLIVRERVLVDDRLKKIILTDKAKLLAEKITLGNIETEERLTKGFSEEELLLFQQFLSRMATNIST